ncbi:MULTISPECIES: hypothetical protein [unclassified Exiguobacterium]|uniref:hypothetical protein n=1 Tax=unclassified Exiguobacterium TaxID=2644629 RepID=UPI00103B415F|nr:MULTISPECIES: hypothetical protein [unclassified Exiguobacterium]TCI42987.1 hypothetical protein EVJ31_13365 [Exiguobacterium sp. SH5S32]TCI49739.1 hypothetical protein EVJ25_13960 [Exiguobacterium sp. SH1S4]TCI67802.1 hypothetical protein EVJ23_13370 [Exiguobacterium sp. SH1S1]
MDQERLIMDVSITEYEVNKSFTFAEELHDKKAASNKQFGRPDILRRRNDYIADHVIGKVVEFGFRRFLEENFNISFSVDLTVWDDPHVHDNGHDMAVVNIDGKERPFRLKTDIKGSRSSSKWLLVEKQKMTDFDTKIYVIGILSNMPDGKDFENDPYKFRGHDWRVSILGYALNRDLVDPETRKGWIEYKAGERLYNPQLIKNLRGKNNNVISNHRSFQGNLTRLINDAPGGSHKHIGPKLDCAVNYGLPIEWLRNTPEDWTKFAKIVHEHSSS